MTGSESTAVGEGRIAWVTGAGRGIGRAVAEALAQRGLRVVLSARSKAQIEEVAASINDAGGKALAIPADVTKQEELTALVAKVRAAWGAIDILVNNAGVWRFTEVTKTTLEEWQEQIAVNLTGAFLCTKAVLEDMLRRGSGHIINIISVAGKRPYARCAAYCAAKYGLLGFTEVLRMEVRKKGIRVTAIFPGATDTPGWEADAERRTQMMRPQSVAQAVVAACLAPPDVMPEEIVLRPVPGDL
ncbi:MAG: SDR family NAD(P)-dependent oxidoreductase [Calditrichaeota bacterium]|nr:SDR family NAD(P)-dependent oxidoreductase [Calditrichota bacterium]